MAKLVGTLVVCAGTGLWSKLRKRNPKLKDSVEASVKEVSAIRQPSWAHDNASGGWGQREYDDYHQVWRRGGVDPGFPLEVGQGGMGAYLLQRMLPLIMICWIILGVLPALYLRVTGQTERLNSIAPVNICFSILCICWWCIRVYSYASIHVLGWLRRDLNQSSYPNTIAASVDPSFKRSSIDFQRSAVPSAISHRLKGRYIKVKEECEMAALETACDAINMSWIMKRAVNLIKGMELNVTSTELQVAIFSVIPWFKIRENYLWDGTRRKYMRRDFRSGKSSGSIQARGPSESVISLAWDAPFKGSERCTLKLMDDRLISDTTMTLEDGRQFSYRQVFKRVSDSA